MSGDVDGDVESFLREHEDAELTEKKRVRCTLTRHEMPPDLRILQRYWTGKAYRRAIELHSYDFTQHEPHIVPHTKNRHLLYCNLTKRPISKQRRVVEGHVSSKRWKRLKERATAAASAAPVGGDDEAAESGRPDKDPARTEQAIGIWVPESEILDEAGDADGESGGADAPRRADESQSGDEGDEAEASGSDDHFLYVNPKSTRPRAVRARDAGRVGHERIFTSGSGTERPTKTSRDLNGGKRKLSASARAPQEARATTKKMRDCRPSVPSRSPTGADHAASVVPHMDSRQQAILALAERIEARERKLAAPAKSG